MFLFTVISGRLPAWQITRIGWFLPKGEKRISRLPALADNPHTKQKKVMQISLRTHKFRFTISSKKTISRDLLCIRDRLKRENTFKWRQCKRHFFTDALSIFVLFLSLSVFCLHACRQVYFYCLPLIMRRHELNRSLRYLFISGSTGSKKSLETGKYSLT